MRRFIFGSRKRKIVAAVVALALILATVAVAAWLVSGSATGNIGANGSLAAPTLSPDSAATGLFPGGDTQATFLYDNPNPVMLTITDGGTAVVTGTVACPAANYSVDTSGLVGAELVANATGHMLNGGHGVQVFLSSGAPTGCQGASATFTISGIVYSTS